MSLGLMMNNAVMWCCSWGSGGGSCRPPAITAIVGALYVMNVGLDGSLTLLRM